MLLSKGMRTLLVIAIAIMAAMMSGGVQAQSLRLTVGTVQKSDHNTWLVKQLRCLITTMDTEARAESEYGMALVAYVVMNRLRTDPRQWGDSPCKVAYQIRITKRGGLVSQFAGPIHSAKFLREDDPQFLRIATIAAKVYMGTWQPKREHACVVAYQRPEHANASAQSWFAGLHAAGKVDHHVFYCLPQARTVIASK